MTLPKTPQGTGRGISYGCPCGEHVGIVATTDEAIAAIRECPGQGQPAGRSGPEWLRTKPPRPAQTPAPEGTPDGTPERTP